MGDGNAFERFLCYVLVQYDYYYYVPYASLPDFIVIWAAAHLVRKRVRMVVVTVAIVLNHIVEEETLELNLKCLVRM